LPEIAIARTSAELVDRLSGIRGEADEGQRDKLRQAANWFVRPFARPWRERIVELLFDVVRRRTTAEARASGAFELAADR
jgi:hypothetical protein